MSQHDFSITSVDANTGLVMRAQINGALQALASCSIGATAPAVTYAGQLWADTTSDRLKMRNTFNSAWIEIYELSTGRPVQIPSSVSSTELGYLDGVTSAIQTQLNGKQATVTGGASSIVSSNLTPRRTIVSDASGKVAVSSVTDSELGYLSGATSNVQAQLNSKAPALYPEIFGHLSLLDHGAGIRFNDETTMRHWHLHMHDNLLKIYDPDTHEEYTHTLIEHFVAWKEFGNGFQQLPNGLIFQWVLGPPFNGEYSATVNLPLTFPHINLSTLVSTHTVGRDAMFQTSDWQRSSVTVFCNSFNSAGGSLQPIIFSIGY
jgi:hypothetical protein